VFDFSQLFIFYWAQGGFAAPDLFIVEVGFAISDSLLSGKNTNKVKSG